jgi:hypothetical protein
MNGEQNVTEYNLGGRFIPRSLVATNTSAADLTSALQFIIDNGGVISGLSINVSRKAKGPANSVNPLWRSALFSATIGT